MARSYEEVEAPVMSVMDWIIVHFIMAVPILNIIMLFVWAFGDDVNPNKANWAKSQFVIIILFSLFFGVMFTFIFGMIGANGGFDELFEMINAQSEM